MALINDYPNSCVSYIEPVGKYSIERDPFLLLIEEVIDNSLRYHNLHNWIPPVNLDVARSINEFTYFNEGFAATVVSPDTEDQAMWLVNRLGFDKRRWLEFNDRNEARCYLEYHLLNIYYYYQPFMFQMFSFACYASRIALQRYRYSLVNDVVWALLAALRKILPYEEYYRRYNFEANAHNNRRIGNQPHDVDEGIVDEDHGSSGIGRNLSLVHVDPILLFVEELIDYSLRYDNLHSWVPAINLEILRKTEMRYFTENLGRAITHSCTENYTVFAARERGFSEERWLELYIPSEARNFQNYFLRQVLHFNDEFLMLSFACYSSKTAMQSNRNSLVNEVVSALVQFLRQYYPHQRHYKEFDDWAIRYNSFHLHSNSIDDGLENEVIVSEESSEADFFESEDSSYPEEQNETEERDSQSPIVGNIGKEGSTSKENTEWEALEEVDGMHTFKKEIGIHILEDSRNHIFEKDIGILEDSSSDISQESR